MAASAVGIAADVTREEEQDRMIRDMIDMLSGPGTFREPVETCTDEEIQQILEMARHPVAWSVLLARHARRRAAVRQLSQLPWFGGLETCIDNGDDVILFRLLWEDKFLGRYGLRIATCSTLLRLRLRAWRLRRWNILHFLHGLAPEA